MISCIFAQLLSWCTLIEFRSMFLLFALLIDMKLFYISFCLGTMPSNFIFLFKIRNYALEYHGVHCSFISLGQTLMPDGHIDNFLIPCFCRKLFEDNHPSKSGRYYFFSYIGVCKFVSFHSFFTLPLCFSFWETVYIYHFSFKSFLKFMFSFFSLQSARKAYLSYLIRCMRTWFVLHSLVLLLLAKAKDLISLTGYVVSQYVILVYIFLF
jgi:hypothetical protein